MTESSTGFGRVRGAMVALAIVVATALVVRGNEVELTLTGGLKWKAPRESFTLVQPLAGKATYLSDLTAESYRHLPFLSTTWPYRTDRNVAGTQLRSGGRLYAKGIGMHSASRLTYRLDGLYKRFEADLALDDQTAGGGSVAGGIGPKYFSIHCFAFAGSKAPTTASTALLGA